MAVPVRSQSDPPSPTVVHPSRNDSFSAKRGGTPKPIRMQQIRIRSNSLINGESSSAGRGNGSTPRSVIEIVRETFSGRRPQAGAEAMPLTPLLKGSMAKIAAALRVYQTLKEEGNKDSTAKVIEIIAQVRLGIGVDSSEIFEYSLAEAIWGTCKSIKLLDEGFVGTLNVKSYLEAVAQYHHEISRFPEENSLCFSMAQFALSVEKKGNAEIIQAAAEMKKQAPLVAEAFIEQWMIAQVYEKTKSDEILEELFSEAEDKKRFSAAYIDYFGEGRLRKLKELIGKEIAGAKELNDFRGNDLIVGAASHYVRGEMQPLIQKISGYIKSHHVSMHKNHSKKKHDVQSLAGSPRYKDFCKKVFAEMAELLVRDLPSNVLELQKYRYKELSNTELFYENAAQLTGNWLFLRVICPALMEGAEIKKSHFTKILLKIVNNEEFEPANSLAGANQTIRELRDDYEELNLQILGLRNKH